MDRMKLFDKRFVYFMWDKTLEGKEGFVADDISDLITRFIDGSIKHTCIMESFSLAYPFRIDDTSCYRFFYYDPNYIWKCAYLEGKQVQFKSMGNDCDNWYPVLPTHNWDNDNLYRVAPEKERMTYRQMAEWAIKQNGEIKSLADPGYVFCDFSYKEGLESEEIPEGYQIRRWDSDKWIEPTLNVYLEDCRRN